MGGAASTLLILVGRSVHRSNRPPASCPRNRPSSVRQAFVSHVRWLRRHAADDRWRTMNIHRLDGTLWLAGSYKLQYYANGG